jgi:tetratricopeptide (TPR) repeat protein
MRFGIVLIRLAAIAAAALAIERFSIAPYHCTHIIPLVEQRTHVALERADEYRSKEIARTNLELLDLARRGCHNEVDLYLLLAFNKHILGHTDAALADLNAALQIDNRPELYFDRGMMLVDQGKIDDAVRELATAIEFNPTLVSGLDGELLNRVNAEVKNRTPGEAAVSPARHE